MKLETRGKYKYVKQGLQKETAEHRAILHRIDPRDDEDVLVVHHIDGNKANNDPANLQWMTREEHSRLHHLGENHYKCDGEDNPNYRHGMCVGGHSAEYKSIQNRKSYQKHRAERLAAQNAYGAEHREHKRWADKLKYWTHQLDIAQTEDRKAECMDRISMLKEKAA